MTAREPTPSARAAAARPGAGRVALFVALATLPALLLAGCRGGNSRSTGSAEILPAATGPGAPSVGRPPPPFTLTATNGETVSLDQFRGKVVLINFWATWCEPCKRELPAIEAVQRQFGERGFAALAVDTRDPDAAVTEFAARTPLSFPLLLDSGGATAARYRLLGVPTSYLLDRDGVLRAIHPGPYTERALAHAVGSLLGESGEKLK